MSGGLKVACLIDESTSLIKLHFLCLFSGFISLQTKPAWLLYDQISPDWSRLPKNCVTHWELHFSQTYLLSICQSAFSFVLVIRFTNSVTSANAMQTFNADPILKWWPSAPCGLFPTAADAHKKTGSSSFTKCTKPLTVLSECAKRDRERFDSFARRCVDAYLKRIAHASNLMPENYRQTSCVP